MFGSHDKALADSCAEAELPSSRDEVLEIAASPSIVGASSL